MGAEWLDMRCTEAYVGVAIDARVRQPCAAELGDGRRKVVVLFARERLRRRPLRLEEAVDDLGRDAEDGDILAVLVRVDVIAEERIVGVSDLLVRGEVGQVEEDVIACQVQEGEVAAEVKRQRFRKVQAPIFSTLELDEFCIYRTSAEATAIYQGASPSN